MKPLNELGSQKIRQAFIDRFVDQTTEHYKMIKEAKSHGDLAFYAGHVEGAFSPYRKIRTSEGLFAKDFSKKRIPADG